MNGNIEVIAIINEEHRMKIKHSCAPCKPSDKTENLPCGQACEPGAISHSW